MTAHPLDLNARIHAVIEAAGGCVPFDAFMHMALYEPGLGYYSNASQKFGKLPSSGSDFVTAPEISPLFGQTLAVQVREALQLTQSHAVYEFGAGTGALALQMLDALGDAVEHYCIVDVSGALRERQAQALAAYPDKVRWLDQWPERIEGVVVGNEVLDAMPVQVLQRRAGVWHERCVASQGEGFAWSERVTTLRPPIEVVGTHDYCTEIHLQGEAFVTSLAERLRAGRGGTAFLIDYGFPEAEYYHPERSMGTLLCHHRHRSDDRPLEQVGHKDITAHVNFSAMALAGQTAGLNVLGYTSQAHFLLNLGLAERMQASDLPTRSMAMKLIQEHEMGELFKVLGFSTHEWAATGFDRGDRSHTL